MSGKKSITLYNGTSKPIHSRYRYKIPQTALNRAVQLSMAGVNTVQVWDLERGRELCTLTRSLRRVTIEVPK